MRRSLKIAQQMIADGVLETSNADRTRSGLKQTQLRRLSRRNESVIIYLSQPKEQKPSRFTFLVYFFDLYFFLVFLFFYFLFLRDRYG